MIKSLFVFLLLGASACGSDSTSDTPASGGATGSQGCPDVSGAWHIAHHCDASLVGMTLSVMQKDCALTFAAPFDSFMGTLTSDGKITMSGPQSCTGTATAEAVSMVCTPGSCSVTLAR